MAIRQTRSVSKKMQSASNPVDKAKDVSNDTSVTKITDNPSTIDLATSKTSDTNTNTGDTDHIVTMDNENKEETTNENDINDEKTEAEKDKDDKKNDAEKDKEEMIAPKDRDEDEVMLTVDGQENVTTDGNNEKEKDATEDKEKDVTDDEDEVEVLEKTPAKQKLTANLRPGGNAGSYRSAVANGTPLTHNGQPNSFLIMKDYSDNPDYFNLEEESDEDTVQQGGSQTTLQHARFKLMVAIPTEKEGMVQEDSLPAALEKVNAMIRSLRNKKPNVRVGHWNWQDDVNREDLLEEVPTDVDTAEKVMYGFQRFVRPGQYCYYRLNLYFLEETDLATVTYYTEQFRIQRQQYLELAPSDALEPLELGTFTGSVEAMASSPNVKACFRRMFALKHLGLTWEFAKGTKGFKRDKFKMHAEIDMRDRHKKDDIRTYFNRKSTSLISNFLGTPMLLAPTVTPGLDNNEKQRAIKQIQSHEKLMKNLEYCTVYGVQSSNYVDNKARVTLLQKLMEIESITPKRLVRNDSTFYGRLFYAIIPNRTDNSVTFYYSRANVKEGRSCAQALPALIRDELKLEPSFFCNSELIAEVKSGHWEASKRFFQTAEEKEESDQMALFEDQAEAEVVEFVSPAHQKALAMDGQSIGEDTRLTKGDAAPPKIAIPPNIIMNTNGDDNTTLTNGTTESKAEAYAGKVAKQLTSTYNSKLLDKEKEIEDLRKKLEADDDASNRSDRTSDSKAAAYAGKVAKELARTYNVKLTDRDKEIQALREQNETRDKEMAAMEARFQAILSSFKTKDTKQNDMSSQQSEDGSKNSGQASGEREEINRQPGSDGWEDTDINALLQDANNGGKKTRTASEISRTPTRSEKTRNIDLHSNKRKEFRPVGENIVMLDDSEIDSTVGRGPAGGGED